MEQLNAKTIQLPRTVFIADDNAYFQIASDKNQVTLLNDKDVVIMPYSAEPFSNKEFINEVRELLKKQNIFHKKQLLVLNPYSAEKYEVADKAVETFALAKYDAITVVAMHLGAKSVEFEDVFHEKNKLLHAFNLKAKFGQEINANSKASKQLTNQIMAKRAGKTLFEGSEPDINAAIQYMTETNIMHDQQLSHLIRLQSRNKIKSYELMLNGSQETESVFKATLELAATAPVGATGAGMEFTRQYQASKSSEIKILIKF